MIYFYLLIDGITSELESTTYDAKQHCALANLNTYESFVYKKTKT